MSCHAFQPINPLLLIPCGFMDVVSCHSTYYSIDVDAMGMVAKMFKTCMSCHEIQPINPLMLIQLGVIEGL
jgi:hypothetical protein